jgi:hypothetical protein
MRDEFLVSASGDLVVPLDRIFLKLSEESKKKFIKDFCISDDVIRIVTNYICGEDDEGFWTSEEMNMRQNILERIENTQLVPRYLSYSWRPWRDLQKRLQDIRCKQHVYWAIHHCEDQELGEKMRRFLASKGVASDYTTKQADADIEDCKQMILSTLKSMHVGIESDGGVA